MRVFRNELEFCSPFTVIRWLFGSLNNLLAGNFDIVMLFPNAEQMEVGESLIQNSLLMRGA